MRTLQRHCYFAVNTLKFTLVSMWRLKVRCTAPLPQLESPVVEDVDPEQTLGDLKARLAAMLGPEFEAAELAIRIGFPPRCAFLFSCLHLTFHRICRGVQFICHFSSSTHVQPTYENEIIHNLHHSPR